MNTSEASARPKSPWLKTGIVALGATLVLAGGFGVARASGVGPALRHAYHGHHGAMAHDFVEYRLTKALDQVGATDAQKREIKAIVDAGLARHKALSGQHQALHAQLQAALSGETVDRTALEAVRAQAISTLDERSKDLARSLAAIAEVLTPAQRAQLAALHQKHRDPSPSE